MKLFQDALNVNSDGQTLNTRRTDPSGEFNPCEAIRELEGLARAETPGRRTVGRPDLALSTLDPQIMAVDEFRKDTAQPQSIADWNKESETLLADYDATKARLIRIGLTPGGILNPAETRAAQQIVAREMKRAFESSSEEVKKTFKSSLTFIARQAPRPPVSSLQWIQMELLKNP